MFPQGIASSSLAQGTLCKCPDGGIGIRASLRNWFPQGIGGSSPLLGTMKNITVEKNSSGKRIDKFLKEEVFFNEKISRGEITRKIKDGNVLTNNKKIKPSYILKENDEIEVNFEKESGKLVPNKNIKFEIIYQDKNIIAINKPAGISVHPSKLSETNTLANWLVYEFPGIKSVGDEPEIRPGIVHRLDKDTSGVMIVARNQKTFEELKKKFKNREVEKKYLAIVYGKMENSKGTIEKSIARSSNYKKQIIAGRKTRTKIRLALTEYGVIKKYKKYSLIEASPKTGRMHQIRVHMKSIGHPIIGDKIYKLKNSKDGLFAKRQMLHARSIELSLFAKKYSFSAELPEDFSEIIDCLTLLNKN